MSVETISISDFKYTIHRDYAEQLLESLAEVIDRHNVLAREVEQLRALKIHDPEKRFQQWIESFGKALADNWAQYYDATKEVSDLKQEIAQLKTGKTLDECAESAFEEVAGHEIKLNDYSYIQENVAKVNHNLLLGRIKALEERVAFLDRWRAEEA